MDGRASLLLIFEFFIRILVACICGTCIGVERSKRFKEAGVRTHVIVCSASALMMIVSKYGFADMAQAGQVIFDGVKAADPSRIASQVVNGISFLGAGVIFKHGSNVKGLTTAAGLWATAGIGLAVGAGMYSVAAFTTIVMLILQFLMHKFAIGADLMSSLHIQFTVERGEGFQDDLEDFFQEQKFLVQEMRIVYDDDGFINYDMRVRTNHELSASELDRFLSRYGAVRGVSCTTVG